MRKYHHETSYHRPVSYHQHIRFVRRMKWGVFIVFTVALVVGAAFVIDVMIQEDKSSTPSAETDVSVSTILPSIKIFRTSHFQFQAPKSWTEIAGETTANKFVYRSLNKSLIQQELVVYINEDPNSKEATMVLPVEVRGGNSLQAGAVSEHCKKAVPPTATRDSQPVKFAGVSFMCAPDSVGFVVAVGQENGNTAITLMRPDDSTAVYRMIYRDVTANPDPRDLISIINSFETR